MVEKWMQSKNACPFRNAARNKAHFGRPNMLFRDSDKDRVDNVFDCKPYNKRRQDVVAQMSGGNPLAEMYGRQEQSRQQRVYEQQLKGILKQQEAQQAKAEKDYADQVAQQNKAYEEALYEQKTHTRPGALSDPNYKANLAIRLKNIASTAEGKQSIAPAKVTVSVSPAKVTTKSAVTGNAFTGYKSSKTGGLGR